eukprot:scaffold345_cov104-Isochrysis_galbana.AAC.18
MEEQLWAGLLRPPPVLRRARRRSARRQQRMVRRGVGCLVSDGCGGSLANGRLGQVSSQKRSFAPPQRQAYILGLRAPSASAHAYPQRGKINKRILPTV